MTDGFTEFFCLYLYGVYTIDGATVLEVIDFMIDKTYFMVVFKYSRISVWRVGNKPLLCYQDIDYATKMLNHLKCKG